MTAGESAAWFTIYLDRSYNYEDIKNKQILVAADVAGFHLKEAVVAHLKKNGWEVTDVGVHDEVGTGVEIFHRMAIRTASMVSEGKFDRAMMFCGTGMGVHLAANKVPRVRLRLWKAFRQHCAPSRATA